MTSDKWRKLEQLHEATRREIAALAKEVDAFERLARAILER
jgi:hypothetical protein